MVNGACVGCAAPPAPSTVIANDWTGPASLKLAESASGPSTAADTIVGSAPFPVNAHSWYVSAAPTGGRPSLTMKPVPSGSSTTRALPRSEVSVAVRAPSVCAARSYAALDVRGRGLLRLVEVVVQRHDLQREHDHRDRGHRGDGGSDPHRRSRPLAGAPLGELVGGRLVFDLRRDAVPELLRRGFVDAGRGCERSHRLEQLVDLPAGSGVLFEVLFDLGPFVRLERVEDVCAEQGVHVAGFDRRHWCTPASMRAARKRSRPDRIRLFTVPSGCSSSTATSL